VLLAAIRAAVLWRQLGGSYWDLALRRRAIAESARAWLNRSEP
jgi:high frequency lysogenization protein